MKNCTQFCAAVHSAFPALAEKADRRHLVQWGDPAVDELDFYCWFGSVANVLNDRMRSGDAETQTAEFFDFVSKTWADGEDTVKNCIDVSLIENLFWQVSPQKAKPYWAVLPSSLQALYLGFHSRPPI
jgi:hypothetical protein